MNKKTTLGVLLAAIFLLPLEGFSQEPVHWEVTLDGALRVAGRTDRLVLLLFTGPDCVYCRRLEAQVLPDPNVTAELQKDYIPVKIKPDHFPSTENQYGVTGLPTTVIVSPQGQMIDSVRGWVKPSEYAAWLHNVALRARPAGAIYAQIPGGAAPSATTPASRTQPSPASGPTPGQGAATQPAAAGLAGGAGPQPAGAPWQPGYGAQSPGGGQWAPGLVAPGYAGQPSPGGPPTAAPAMSPNNPPSYGSPAAPPGYGPAMGAYGSGATGLTSPAPVSGPTGAGQWSNPPPAAPPYGQQPPAAQPAGPPMAGAVPAIPPGNPPLGLDGCCPVSLAEKSRWVPGDRRWGAIHRGRTYLFAGPAEQRRFLADPDRYAPLFSGNDIVMAVDGGQVVPGMRQHGVFLLPSGRVLLFASEETLAKFTKEPGRYGEQAMASLRAGMNPGAIMR